MDPAVLGNMVHYSSCPECWSCDLLHLLHFVKFSSWIHDLFVQKFRSAAYIILVSRSDGPLSSYEPPLVLGSAYMVDKLFPRGRAVPKSTVRFDRCSYL